MEYSSPAYIGWRSRRKGPRCTKPRSEGAIEKESPIAISDQIENINPGITKREVVVRETIIPNGAMEESHAIISIGQGEVLCGGFRKIIRKAVSADCAARNQAVMLPCNA